MSEHEADFRGYDALFDPARQDPTTDPAYEAWLKARECPLHGPTRVVDYGEVPSMLGHGWEDWEVQECGCSLTWDPFSGAERWSPARG